MLPPARNSLPSPTITPTKRSRQPVASACPFTPVTPRAITNIFAHANQLLSTSSNPSDVPFLGRTIERSILITFLDARFPGVLPPSPPHGHASTSAPTPQSPSLYVSGPPGIGKTALLSSVIGDFARAVDDGGHGEHITVHMENCSSMGSVALEASMWDRLCKGLDIGGTPKLKGKERFEAGLNSGRKL